MTPPEVDMSHEEERDEGHEEAAAEPETLDLDPQAVRKALEEQASKADSHLANWQKAEAALSNYKKRAEQEREELVTSSSAMLVSGLLPVLDDLDRAFGSLSPDLAALTWIDGVKLIYRKLKAILQSQGLSVIETDGQSFDPALHEAVIQGEGEEGKVLGELQRGYKFHDRVIRPAMVKVGGGKAGGEAGDSSSETSPGS